MLRKRKKRMVWAYLSLLALLLWLLIPLPFIFKYVKAQGFFAGFMESGVFGIYSVEHRMKKGNKVVILVPLPTFAEAQFCDSVSRDIAKMDKARVIIGAAFIPIDVYSFLGVKMIHEEVSLRLKQKYEPQLEEVKKVTETLLASPRFGISNVVTSDTPMDLENFKEEFQENIRGASATKLMETLDLGDILGVHQWGMTTPTHMIHVAPPNKISLVPLDTQYYIMGRTLKPQASISASLFDINYLKQTWLPHIFYLSAVCRTNISSEQAHVINTAVKAIDRASPSVFVIPWDTACVSHAHKLLLESGFEDVEQHRRLAVSNARIYVNRLFWRLTRIKTSLQLWQEERLKHR